MAKNKILDTWSEYVKVYYKDSREERLDVTYKNESSWNVLACAPQSFSVTRCWSNIIQPYVSIDTISLYVHCMFNICTVLF